MEGKAGEMGRQNCGVLCEPTDGPTHRAEGSPAIDLQLAVSHSRTSVPWIPWMTVLSLNSVEYGTQCQKLVYASFPLFCDP